MFENLILGRVSGEIDFLKEARNFATSGSGVSVALDTEGRYVHTFNGTSNAWHEFPSNKYSLFSFINVPFLLEMEIKLNTTALCQPIGNLRDLAGTSNYAFTFNNTYQTVSKLSIDGNTASGVQRYRFGAGATKLPTGVWTNLKVVKLADAKTIQFYQDNVLISEVANTLPFLMTNVNPWRIGTSSDGAYPVNGAMRKLTVKK